VPEVDESAAREHYASVGKSKLRKKDIVPLGPRYEGAKISRDAVEDEEDDDPFSKGFDEEESESEEEIDAVNGDEGLQNGDESPVTDPSNAEDDEEDDDDRAELRKMMAEGPSDEDDDDDDDGEGEDDDDEDEDVDQDASNDRTALRKLMTEEQKQVTSALSQAAKADAEKGRAVKRQRATFDSLLNTRVKLQKALIGANTLTGLANNEPTEDDPEAAFQAAENAAFNLWSSLNSLRETLESNRTGKKRKHTEFTSDSPTSELWAHMRAQESSAQPHRKIVLEKWSNKARGAAAIPARNRLNASASEQTIVDVLQEQLSGDRLVKRARTPRSCAPLQLSQKVAESSCIYDDADFYGLLLQSLLEQRSADSVAASASAANIDVAFQMRREAKTKKNVDTKASKGRKLRYTVHEKLQNFMAPEDRSLWGDRQADELFGSLFGRKMGLGEDEEDGEDEKMGDAADEDVQEAGLMLFRN